MSIFDYSQDCPVDIRPRKAKIRELSVWNEISQQYERVTSDGGTPLPYYLETNSININQPTDGQSASMNQSSLGVTEGSSYSVLKKDALVFGDSSGPATFNRQSVLTFNSLSSSLGATPETINDGFNTQLVAYDSAQNKFINPLEIQIKGSTSTAYLGSQRLRIASVTGGIVDITPSGGFKHSLGNLSSSYKYDESRLYSTTDTSIGTLTTPTDIRFGGITYNNTIDTGDYSILSRSGLTLKDSVGSEVLTRGSIAVTNQLKDLTTVTTGPLHRMVVYNTGSKAYNYTAIPTLPSYLQPNNILMTTGGKQINMDGTGILFKDSSSTTPDVEIDKNVADTAWGLYNIDPASSTTGKKMVVYDSSLPVDQRYEYADIPNAGTSYSYIQSNGINMAVGSGAGQFANGIRLSGTVDGIQTALDGDTITMSDFFSEPMRNAEINFDKFSRLSKVADFKTQSKLIDLSKCQTLKFASGNTPTVTGTPGQNPAITGFKAGDKYVFKNITDFTFDPDVWYALPMVNVHTTTNVCWKITLHRHASEAGSPDSFAQFHTYDYNKDTAQVRYTSVGTGTIPSNSLLFQIKIGSGNRQWSERDVFCIELVEYPTIV